MPDNPSSGAPPETTAPVYQARLAPGGQRFNAPADLPLLQAAERAGLAVVSSCRNGTCRACICQLASGRVVYRIDWPGLSPDEKAAGCILPCVASTETNAPKRLTRCWTSMTGGPTDLFIGPRRGRPPRRRRGCGR